MTTADQYELHPTPEQEAQLTEFSVISRFTYNWCLLMMCEALENEIQYAEDDLQRRFDTLKADTEYAWLRKSPCWLFHDAWQRAFRKVSVSKNPKLDVSDVIAYPALLEDINGGLSIRGTDLIIQSAVCPSTDGGVFRSVIKRHANGRWFFSLRSSVGLA